MIRIESGCVCCQKPCIFDACPYYRVEAYYCDHCKGYEPAEYLYEGWHYCGDCLEKKLDSEFGALPLREKIELLMLEDEIMEV